MRTMLLKPTKSGVAHTPQSSATPSTATPPKQAKQDTGAAIDLAGVDPAVVDLVGVSKTYREPHHVAVDHLSLRVHKGEIVTLLGPSGCGKTTLLRMIAGFERPDTGEVVIKGKVMSQMPFESEGGKSEKNVQWIKPEKRQVGFVFQDYALFPHLTVLDNVLFGLPGGWGRWPAWWSKHGNNGASSSHSGSGSNNQSRGHRHQRKARARDVLALVGLADHAQRYPHQLSGGQQQRVALARALAPAPAVMLLDEPFSNLDAALRVQTRAEVRHILKATHTTAILVTHDQEEALTFADRVAVMCAGKLEQVDTPERIYLQPKTEFVATFLGTANILPAHAQGQQAQCLLGRIALAQPAQGEVQVSLRPEDIAIAPLPSPAALSSMSSASSSTPSFTSFEPSASAEEGITEGNTIESNTTDGNTTDAAVRARVINREFKGHDLTYICELCTRAVHVSPASLQPALRSSSLHNDEGNATQHRTQHNTDVDDSTKQLHHERVVGTDGIDGGNDGSEPQHHHYHHYDPSPCRITVHTGPHKQVQEGDWVMLSVKGPAVVLEPKDTSDYV